MASGRSQRSDQPDVIARVAMLEAQMTDVLARLPSRIPFHANHAALIQAIEAAIGSRPFTAKMLFAYVRVTHDETLQTALADAGVTTPKELGWVLRRSMPQVGDFSIQRFPRMHRDGWLWQVVRDPRLG